MKTKKKITFQVTDELQGIRLDKAVATLADISSRSLAQNLINKQFVCIDGKIAKSSAVLKLNQIIEVIVPELIAVDIQPLVMSLDIVYEDDDLIVVNKPAHLVVHPAAGHEQDTLVNALMAHTSALSMKNEQRPGIVHRIDKETSGLLVIAKNDSVHENLATQFKNKTTHRVYYALVDGNLKQSSGTIRSYLARHPTQRKRFASVRINNHIIREFHEQEVTGKWAVTHFTKLATASGMTLVKIKLETGRTHQIRVHFSELGHPLVGDTLYGYSALKIKNLKLKRFFLNAAELGFEHPRLKKNFQFSVNWPIEDLHKLKELGFNLDSFQNGKD